MCGDEGVVPLRRGAAGKTAPERGVGRGVFAFLMRPLLAGRTRDSAEARAYRAFARAFIDAAAERDGFVELVAMPETGGFFAQGWSRSAAASMKARAKAR